MRLSSDAILEIQLRRFCGEPVGAIARRFGISRNSVNYHTLAIFRQEQNQRSETWRQANRARARAYNSHWRVSWARRKLYGIDDADWQGLLEAQDGRCGICGEQPGHTLCVDHDHVTGRVRGLLCRECNHMLGNARDNIATLHAAVSYLGEL